MKIAKIDVTKIDKAKLFKGEKGTYLDLVLIDNKAGTDQYGNDGFVKQGSSKEDREAGVEMPIIGNWKRVGPKKAQPAPKPASPIDHSADDVPF